MQFIQGKKTYLVCAIGVCIGAYDALIPYMHLSPIPNWIYILLAVCGLGAARSGISTDTQKAVSDVLSQIAPISSATANPIAITLTNNTDKPQEIQSPDNLTFTRTIR